MNPTYDFTGQVAFVTGASSGMGLATPRAFAQAGAAVTLTDVNTDPLRAAETDLRDAGHQVLAVPCDVADETQVAATVQAFGSLDLAYNNAGIQSPMVDAADEPAEVFDRVNAINLRGIWASMKHRAGRAARRRRLHRTLTVACGLATTNERASACWPDQWCTARWRASASRPKSAVGSRQTECAWFASRWVLSHSMSSRGPCTR